MLLTPNRVREIGLGYMNISKQQQERMSDAFKTEVFHLHYGSSPLDIAEIWFDLQQGDHEGATLTVKENCLLGFKHFMKAHFFLWVYPRNAGLMATRFDMCERYCRGEHLFKWIRKLARLCAKKIKWDKSLGKAGTSMFLFSIDCTNLKTWEKRRHYHFNVDKRLYSSKSNLAGLKYEILMNITKSKCMNIVGPRLASEHDMEVFHLEAKAKLLATPGAFAIADGIYKPGKGRKEEVDILAIQNSNDDDQLRAFKSRVRCRHESFNGQIKNFAFLQHTFRGTDYEKHGDYFRAICVIVQYQMDNGSPLFSVN